MVRATGEGVSAAYDYQGRVLATTNSFTSPEAAMVAHVPTLGTRTIYSVIGDLFALLCAVGFTIIVGRVVFRRQAA
jgi:apolipoprotein N-acyltransferase